MLRHVHSGGLSANGSARGRVPGPTASEVRRFTIKRAARHQIAPHGGQPPSKGNVSLLGLPSEMKSRRTLTGSAAKFGTRDGTNTSGGTVGRADWLRDSFLGIRRLAHPGRFVSSASVETLTATAALGTSSAGLSPCCPCILRHRLPSRSDASSAGKLNSVHEHGCGNLSSLVKWRKARSTRLKRAWRASAGLGPWLHGH